MQNPVALLRFVSALGLLFQYILFPRATLSALYANSKIQILNIFNEQSFVGSFRELDPLKLLRVYLMCYILKRCMNAMGSFHFTINPTAATL